MGTLAAREMGGNPDVLLVRSWVKKGGTHGNDVSNQIEANYNQQDPLKVLDSSFIIGLWNQNSEVPQLAHLAFETLTILERTIRTEEHFVDIAFDHMWVSNATQIRY
jgi:hypothetical protein